MGKDTSNSAKIVTGTITTKDIKYAHQKIREIETSYNDMQLKVSNTTQVVYENWVGEGRNEFQTQYELLISKINDFGDHLKELYQKLVEAEAKYQTGDDQLRQEFVKAMSE